MKEFFEYNNVILNIPSIEKKKINKIYLNANQNENYNSFKAQNSENNIFKKKIYVDDKNSDYNLYSINENISYQNNIEIINNKKYNDNIFSRLNNNNDKSAASNKKNTKFMEKEILLIFIMILSIKKVFKSLVRKKFLY